MQIRTHDLWQIRAPAFKHFGKGDKSFGAFEVSPANIVITAACRAKILNLWLKHVETETSPLASLSIDEAHLIVGVYDA